MTKSKKTIILLIFVLLLSVLMGCSNVKVGELKEEDSVIELGEAKALRTEVKMGGGELVIMGGTDQALNAKFTYNVEDWKPNVAYKVTGTIGELLIEQPAAITNDLFSGDTTYQWKLMLNDQIPTDLTIDFGAGKADLGLGDLNLNDLELHMGAGNAVVNLANSKNLKNLDIKMGAGDLTVDLTGDLQTDLLADFNGGVGKARLVLPKEIGVRVDAVGGLGKVEADGFTKNGDSLVNEAYGDSGVTLNIKIRAGIGKIILEME